MFSKHHTVVINSANLSLLPSPACTCCKGASPNDFCTLSVIVTLRGGGGPGHDVKKKINFQK